MVEHMARWLLRFGRRRWRIIFLSVLLLSLGLPLPTHSDSSLCTDSTRLTVGGVARIAYRSGNQPSESQPLRDFPGEEALVLTNMPPGTTLTVLRGPVCIRDVRWWEVRTLTGMTGWTPETRGNSESAIPVLESWQLLVDLMRPIPNNLMPSGLALIRVNVHGVARWLTAFTPSVPADGGLSSFPEAEAEPLRQAFAAAQQRCPAQARWIDRSVADSFSAFPSPDATRLLIVRHWWRAVSECDGSITPFYGIDRLSVIDSQGERVLFDLPGHVPAPDLSSTTGGDVDPPDQVIDVRWSPDNAHTLAWLRYGDRSRLLIIDADQSTSAFLDDGADPAWSPDGSRVSWLRADGTVTNLISDSPDRLSAFGTTRQTLALPSAFQYAHAIFDPVWNADGTRLVACVRADNCLSAAVIDVPLRRALPALTVPVASPLAVRWALDDSALLWLPQSGKFLILQSISDGVLRTFAPELMAGEHITDVRIFPGGDTALIVVQPVNGTPRYTVLDLNYGSLTGVRFTDS